MKQFGTEEKTIRKLRDMLLNLSDDSFSNAMFTLLDHWEEVADGNSNICWSNGPLGISCCDDSIAFCDISGDSCETIAVLTMKSCK
jgi:hypothetical protein